MDTIHEMGTKPHLSCSQPKEFFRSWQYFYSGVMLHRGGKCFSSSTWSMLSFTMKEVARFGVTFCV